MIFSRSQPTGMGTDSWDHPKALIMGLRFPDQWQGLVAKITAMDIAKVLILALLFTMGGSSAQANVLRCEETLPDRLQTWLQTSALQGATVGIALETLDGREVYHHQADRRLLPASNQKLLTTAAALEQWGERRTWATTVHLRRDPNSTELWLVGQGDPTLTEASLQELSQEVGHQLRQRQVTYLDRLVGDDRFLGEKGTPPTWELADIQTGYGAPVNALVLTENAIPLTLWPQAIGEPLRIEWETPQDALDWKVENFSVSGQADDPEFVVVRNVGEQGTRSVLRVEGVLRSGAAPEPVSVAVSQPGERFLRRLQTALEGEGITIAASELVTFPDSQPLPEAETIATLSSPPLATLVTIANQQSQNLYAEILLRWLGQAQTHPPALGVAPSLQERGSQQISTMLLRWGLSTHEFTIADGSGLSRHNWITPAVLVKVLQYSAQAPWGETYRASLSEAGVSGTLARRFADSPLAGKLWGKTGSMEGTMALSGYLNPDHYAPLAFSILINNSAASYGQLATAIDFLLEDWANLAICQR
ncbi:MAG: D-alanyl-D-alanine carboxypeptidase/D-alanyl-D-alanine endopeptidase [Prochlorotrichaceae cyanobacterium]